jgi:hypothetical protein
LISRNSKIANPLISQNRKIAKSQNRKIAKSRNRKIAKSQNRKIAKSQNRHNRLCQLRSRLCKFTAKWIFCVSEAEGSLLIVFQITDNETPTMADTARQCGQKCFGKKDQNAPN